MNKRRLGVLVAAVSFGCIGLGIIEPRLGLLAGAMLIFLIGGCPSLWFRSFVETMGKTDFLKVILPVFAFTSVANATHCTDAFVSLLAAPVASWSLFLVPLAVLAAFLTNIVLVSATASGLAVGIVFLPILEKAGINPALAAASVLAGTWGAVLSPGSKHAALIADAANKAQSGKELGPRVEAMDVVRGHLCLVIPVLAVVVVLMTLEALLFASERAAVHPDIVSDSPGTAAWVRAPVPLIPLILLWILPLSRNPVMTRLFPSEFLVFQTMLFGTVVAVIVGGKQLLFAEGSPVGKGLADVFFTGDGMANAYGTVMTMIISAMVFVAGLQALGVLDAILALLQKRQRGAAWFGFFGSMGFAALSGSGDAASCSFNAGVTPLARNFGARPRELGSMAWLGAEMGRCFSPVAAVTIAVATTARSEDGPLYIVAWTVGPIAVGGLVGVLLRRTVRG